MINPILLISLYAVAAVRLRDDPPVQVRIAPIDVDAISADAPPVEVQFDANGNPQVVDPNPTQAPSPYRPNDPSVYAIETTLNASLTENALKVNATDEEMDMCKYLTGQVKIDAGCLGAQ